MLYLGGQDVDTARLISERSNKPLHAILSMPLNVAYLFIRGQQTICTEKYEAQEMQPEVQVDNEYPFDC